MKTHAIRKTVYADLLGATHLQKADAEMSNHDVQLKFRRYIEEELIRTFSDGKVDNLATTNEIWKALEFTPECVRDIISIMDK